MMSWLDSFAAAAEESAAYVVVWLCIWLSGIVAGAFLMESPEVQRLFGRIVEQEQAVVAAVKETLFHHTTRAPEPDRWPVTAGDLNFFKERIKDSTDSTASADDWQEMMRKVLPRSVHYTSWRRMTSGGTSEYKSVTICNRATAQEFMDFYLDDSFRCQWDGMIKHTEVLEEGDLTQKEQVVRWIRSFPFNFITDREYTIARRFFEEDGVLYGITKQLPEQWAARYGERLDNEGRVVPVRNFYSMWACETIDSPFEYGQPACRTTLLHHEDLRVPDHMARLTVKIGMWGFVKSMYTKGVRPFVDTRQRRCGPTDRDPLAFSCTPHLHPRSSQTPEPHDTAVGSQPPLPSRRAAPSHPLPLHSVSEIEDMETDAEESEITAEPAGEKQLHRSASASWVLDHAQKQRPGPGSVDSDYMLNSEGGTGRSAGSKSMGRLGFLVLAVTLIRSAVLSVLDSPSSAAEGRAGKASRRHAR